MNQLDLITEQEPEPRSFYCSIHGTVSRCPLTYLWCTDEEPYRASEEDGLDLAQQANPQLNRAKESHDE